MINRDIIPLPSYYHNLLSKIDKSILKEIFIDIVNSEEKFENEHCYLFIEFCVILLSVPGYQLEDFADDNKFKDIQEIWSDYLGKNVRKLSGASRIIESDINVIRHIFKKVCSLIGLSNFEKDLSSEIAIAKYRIDSYREPEHVGYRKVIISEKSLAFLKPFVNPDENILRH